VVEKGQKSGKCEHETNRDCTEKCPVLEETKKLAGLQQVNLNVKLTMGSNMVPRKTPYPSKTITVSTRISINLRNRSASMGWSVKRNVMLAKTVEKMI
jgi:hypothetical protein